MTTRREFLTAGIQSGLATFAMPQLLKATTQADEKLPIVDCHTHFYDPTRPEGVTFPGKGDKVLYRTVLPKHFLEQAAPHGVTKTVVVEASSRVEDNAWLLDLAAKNPAIIGVVGRLTPGQPEFAGHLKRFAANKLYRGIRINQEAVKTGLERSEFLADIRRLSDAGLELDVNGGPQNTAAAARLAEKVPDLRIVINHLGYVDVDGARPPQDWLDEMRAAAKQPRVFCKVSGLIERAKPKNGDKKVPDDVEFYRPILDAIWEIFGDDRLIYGSNWPVSDRAAPYATVFSIVNQYATSRGRTTAEKYFWKNAQTVYQWP